MPPPSLPLSQPEPENKYPDWVFMKLQGIPVQSEKQGIFKLTPKLAAGDRIELYLTLHFREQGEELLGGRIKFGLKGGHLRLRLENGKIPLTSRELKGFCQLSTHKDTQPQETSESRSNKSVSLTESKLAEKVNLDTNQISRKIDSNPFTVCQVTAQGSETHLAWIFQVEKGQPTLKGSLNHAKLATINVVAKPCRVEAIFGVSPHDIYLIEAEGLLPANISKKRKAVIQRAIIHRLLKQKLQPYLSRQELRYD